MPPVYADHPFALIPDPRTPDADGNYHPIDLVTGEMACVHNFLIRALNAIYLQAPHVHAPEAKAFCNYAHQWYRLLHVHHTAEETSFFPLVEERVGQKGIMESNVEQHEAFHDGVEAFGSYVQDCAAGRKVYDGKLLISIIDAFGNSLYHHLTDELVSLSNLKKFGHEPFSDMMEIMAKWGEEGMKEAGLLTGLPFAFSCIDYKYEGGRWASFPPAPAIVRLLIVHIAWLWNASWWKFGPCDKYGSMRPLHAVPKDSST